MAQRAKVAEGLLTVPIDRRQGVGLESVGSSLDPESTVGTRYIKAKIKKPGEILREERATEKVGPVLLRESKMGPTRSLVCSSASRLIGRWQNQQKAR